MKLIIKKLLKFINILIILITISACTSITVIHSWYDNDELLFQEENKSDDILQRDILEDTDMWDYSYWEAETIYNDEQININYYAQKELKKEYFLGNVFQIITYDLTRSPISTGTGFIINESGLFITNAHVVKDAFYISAFFDIEDQTSNNSFTELEIKYLRYFDENKDIAIGRMNNYSKIKEHYKEIHFTENHMIGETTYSIGYPNSSTDLEIHKGKVVEDITSLYSKIVQGISYIGSSSFIAPGSSGGILINQYGEVLGITSVGVTDNDNFVVGGSISYSNFKNQINSSSSYKKIHTIFYPNQVNFIQLFYSLYENTDYEMIEFTDYTRFIKSVRQEGTNSSGVNFLEEKTIIIDSDGYMEIIVSINWENGQKKDVNLYGYYDLDNDPFRYFEFEFYYQWTSSSWMRFTSDNINYSENINLTLIDFVSTSSSNTSITSDYIEYMKENFNLSYEDLLDLF